MKNSDFLPQFSVLWGAKALVNTLQYPLSSDTNRPSGRASIASGFPAENFLPPASGGVYPSGADLNGIFRTLSVSAQNYEAGATPSWSQNFAEQIGGYPLSSQVQDANGVIWVSTADANFTVPGTDNAQWQILGYVPTFINLTQSTTLIPPTNCSRLEFWLTGGGGGGSGCQANSAQQSVSGGSGGGGGTAYGILPISPANRISLTIGSGGTAGVGSGTPAGSGGDSVLLLNNVAQVTAHGGEGGNWYDVTGSFGGFGGTVSSSLPGCFAITGGDGGDGQSGPAWSISGAGGGTFWGGGARAACAGGRNASCYGTGGGGTYDSGFSGKIYSGGAGAPGVIFYRWLA